MTLPGKASWPQTLARFAALCAFAFWQGGFVFYAGVVVPIGSDELGDTLQGFITRRVTRSLNVIGLVALALLLVDHLVHPFQARNKKAFWVLWVLMLGCQTALLILHPMMDLLLEPETVSVLDRRVFRLMHRNYLWTSTILWGASLGWVWLVARDHSSGPPKETPRT